MRLAAAGDRLSPILVKELRQGVRGHLFTGAFLLQVFLLFAVASLSLLLDSGSPGSMEVFTFFFWAFVTVPLVIILPMGAGVSFSGELAANTLEPLLLTRLTAWRLAAGKWAATACQALVLGIAALPFVLVRYYLGRVEVVADLAFMAAYVACSLLLASAAVAISPARLSALFRWCLTALVGITLAITFLATLASVAYARMFTPRGSLGLWASVLGFLAVAVLSILSALEGAALQLAPAARAQPWRLRLLALLSLGVAAALGLRPINEVSGVAIVWASALVAITTVASLCEPVHLLRMRYAAFFRRRALVPLAWLFAPGWPAGVAFLFLAAAAGAVAAALSKGPTAGAFVLGGVLGSLLLPLVVWRSFLPRARSFLLLLLVTLASVTLATVAPAAASVGSQSWWTVGCVLFPLCPAAYALARIGEYGDYGAGANVLPAYADVIFAIVVTVIVVAAVWHTVRAWREIGRLVRPPAAA